MNTFEDYGITVPYGKGGEVATTCPQCSHTRKKKSARCLSVNVDLGVWNCNHCGWTGTLGKNTERIEKEYKRPEPIRLTKLPQSIVDWFSNRGIAERALHDAKVASGTVFFPQTGKESSAIKFQYFRGESLINVKSRDSRKNFRLESGAERILYGLNTLAKETVIVEGEIDCLSVYQCGIKACVSVPDGAPAANTRDYSSKFAFLDSDDLSMVETWIIAVDSDEAGMRLEDELSRRFGRENCKRVIWPSDCKDANEVLVRHGQDALRGCIENAKMYPIAGVFTANDIADRLSVLYDKGLERGVSTGWVNLDPYYTVRKGEMTIVTGMPNSGKSNWIDALMVNLAKYEGWRAAIFSPENQPVDDHMSRMIEKWCGEPFDDGPTPKMDRNVFENGIKWVSERFWWILPDDDSEWTIDTILSRTKALVRRHGVDSLVIDPWNEIEHQRPSNMTETEYTSVVLKKVRQFARHNGIHIWFIAHPTKLHKDRNSGKYPVPTPYDISGSSHWRNKADNCITVFRDFDSPNKTEVQIHIQKVRFRQIGKLGMAALDYNKVVATYRECL